MVINKDKKVKKQRGSKTHGYGSMKKNRGAGNRGGRGNAGSGKRADTIKPSLWKRRVKLQKFGFKKHGIKPDVKTIDIRELESRLDELVKNKFAQSDKDLYTIDLRKAGYTKLLGNGQATKKMNITVDNCSGKAAEKIAAAGGAIQGQDK